MGTGRPTPDAATSPFARILRWSGLVGSVIISIVVAATYASLPDRVPTHFTGAMTADEYGPKWSVLVLGGVMLALSAGVAWIAGKPQWFNYPTPVTEENAPRVYRAARVEKTYRYGRERNG